MWTLELSSHLTRYSITIRPVLVFKPVKLLNLLHFISENTQLYFCCCCRRLYGCIIRKRARRLCSWLNLIARICTSLSWTPQSGSPSLIPFRARIPSTSSLGTRPWKILFCGMWWVFRLCDGCEFAHAGLQNSMSICLKADVILKFVDEEAPAVIQPKTLYIPKPDIQVIIKV